MSVSSSFSKMGETVVEISKIVSGKIDWRLQVKVISLWFILDFKNTTKVNNMEVFLLDEKVLPYRS